MHSPPATSDSLPLQFRIHGMGCAEEGGILNGRMIVPADADEPAHFSQGALAVPKDVTSTLTRYRIVLPGDAGEVTYGVSVDVE